MSKEKRTVSLTFESSDQIIDTLKTSISNKSASFIDTKISAIAEQGRHQFSKPWALRNSLLNKMGLNKNMFLGKWSENKKTFWIDAIKSENYSLLQEKIKKACIFVDKNSLDVKYCNRYFVRIEEKKDLQTDVYYVHFVIDSIQGLQLARDFNRRAKFIDAPNTPNFSYNPLLNCIYIDEVGFFKWQAFYSPHFHVPNPLTLNVILHPKGTFSSSP